MQQPSPLKQISLVPGAASTTNLGFGTTSMMGLPATRDRLGLLEGAFETGIRHFDTAPYYGYGEAERVLGKFLTRRRDQVTITTKYGIQVPTVLKARWVNLLARRLLQLMPFMRKALSRQAQSMSTKCVFNPAEARKSLDQSLAALKTDYVDLFLLHEPTFADAASDEIHSFLEDELQRGRIRAFGCGGDYRVIQSIATAELPTAKWVQFEDNVLQRNIERIRPDGGCCITFGSFKALSALTQWLESVPGRCAQWERELGCDCRSQDAVAGLLQAGSHARNADGIVLFSTGRLDRIASAASIASGNQFSREQLQKFDELVKSVQLPAQFR